MTFWAAGAVAVGGVASALIGSNASKGATNAQLRGADAANALQEKEYDQTRSDNLPALGARNDALSQLEFELGIGSGKGQTGYGAQAGPITVGDVTQDPGYQFGLKQGQAGLSSAETAHGMHDSGASLAAAARYGTDYATTKYDDAFNRATQNRNAQINPFLSLAGAGQVGANTIGTAGEQYATQGGANDRYAADASANGQLAAGSIYGNTVNNLAGWYANNAGRFGSSSPTSYPTGGVGTGAWTDPSTGARYNNPSAYTAGGG